MNRRLSLLLPVLGLVVAGVGCRPSLDGAWDGNADCTTTGDHPVSALFDEQSDSDLKGQMYIENINVLISLVILRADLDNGEYDAGDDEYSFDLNSDGDSEAEFAVTLEIDDENSDDADGDIDQFADNGDVSQTCNLKLSRVSVTNN